MKTSCNWLKPENYLFVMIHSGECARRCMPYTERRGTTASNQQGRKVSYTFFKKRMIIEVVPSGESKRQNNQL